MLRYNNTLRSILRLMLMRLIKFFTLFLGLACVCSGLSSCTLFNGGRQDTGNGTPAVISSITPVLTVPAVAHASTYAYVAGNQLWTALDGAAPKRITSFDDRATPDVYWHIPVWSSGDRYLAVIVSAQPASQGGGGCPGPQFGANGALYVLDTASMSLHKLTVSADGSDAQTSGAQSGYWQTFFWEDATHLLAWYNGAATAKGATAGLYRYDLDSQTLTRVLPLASLGLTTLFDQQAPKSTSYLLGLRYSQGYLYYQEVMQPYTANSKLLIQRISLARTGATPQSVLVQGLGGWCPSAASTNSSTYVEPGWDIASNGRLLVAQMVDQNGSSVETLDLISGQSAQIFAQLPTSALSHDLTLAWSPSAQAVAASESHAFSQDGPFSTTLAQPESLWRYMPTGAGQIAWRPDGQAFSLQDLDLVTAPTTNVLPGPYMYQMDQSSQQGILLLSSASDFAWG